MRDTIGETGGKGHEMYMGAVCLGSRRRHRDRIWKRIRLVAVIAMELCILLLLLMHAWGKLRIGIPETWRNGTARPVQSAGAWSLPGAQSTDAKEKVISEENMPALCENVILGHPVPVIALDAGHGGNDAGCSADGIEEKRINLQIAERVREKLTESGYQVLMIREDDARMELEDRVTLANQKRADAYISIHQNFYEEDGAVCGIETWYYGGDESRDSKRLAQLIHQETTKSTQASARELRDDADFYVTGHTGMPACLIETGFLTNPRERELLATPEYQEKIAGGIAAGIDLYFHPKTMYLTFDDGPSAENTGRVLDILKEHHIKAAFFLVGENVEKNPEMARRIVAEGHTIGIHCYRHDYEEIYQSVDSYLADFEKAYQTILDVTGVEARLFRFPGGSINAHNQDVYEELIEEMTKRGFIYVDWNASLEDALGNAGPEELIANARATTLGRKRVVLLAHDIVYNTGMCLEELLKELPEYRMEQLTEETEPIRFSLKK